MSEFMPEGAAGSPSSGVASVTPSTPAVTDDDAALMHRVLSAAAERPNMIPDGFMAYIIDFIQTSNLTIPIGQVLGFNRFLSTQVSVFTDSGQSLTGTGNTSAAGPSVAVVAGKYFVIVGADMSTQFGNGLAQMTLSPGGLVVSGSQASVASVCKGVPLDLTTDQTISALLQINGGGGAVTCTISGAWLAAIRYDNA